MLAFLILILLVACTSAQLTQAGEATGAAGEIATMAGTATGNPALLVGGIALSGLSAVLLGIGRVVRSRESR